MDARAVEQRRETPRQGVSRSTKSAGWMAARLAVAGFVPSPRREEGGALSSGYILRGLQP